MSVKESELNSMKIQCRRPELINAFQTVGTVVPTRTPKEILKNVKLQIEDGVATLIGTDQEVGIRYQVPGVEVEAGGEVLLPTSRVIAILRELQEDKVNIELTDDVIWIRSGQSEFQLAAQNPEEFPEVAGFDAEEVVVVEGKVLREAIRRTIFATDLESSRYALGGVLMVFEGDKFKMVATDSRRLALVEATISSQNVEGLDELRPVIPRNAVQLIERSILEDDSEIKLAIRENEVLIQCGHSIIYARLVEGRFPNYANVVPQEVENVVDLVVGQFHSVVRLAQIVTNEESRGVVFEFKDGLVSLRSKAAEIGQSKNELPISNESINITVTFDPRYVADFLKVLDPETSFQFKLKDSESAAVMAVGDSYTYVIMPLSQGS